MHCRECGEKYLNDKAVICIKCGVEKGRGHKYCPECGETVPNPRAEVCLKCGVSLKKIHTSPTQVATKPKQKIVAALLAFFFGYLGIHRFYLGYTTIGLIQLLCTVLFGFFTFGFSILVVWICRIYINIM